MQLSLITLVLFLSLTPPHAPLTLVHTSCFSQLFMHSLSHEHKTKTCTLQHTHTHTHTGILFTEAHSCTYIEKEKGFVQRKLEKAQFEKASISSRT